MAPRWKFAWFQKKAKTGFTLVEITLSLAIIGILTAASLPRFVNLASAARMSQENNTIGQLSMAIKTTMLQNVADGMTYEDAFPSQANVIDLLLQKPSFKTITSPSEFNNNSNDNINWLQFATSNNKQVRLFCPHFNGYANGSAYGVNSPECGGLGRVWIYYLETGNYAGQQRNKGDLVLETDAGH